MERAVARTRERTKAAKVITGDHFQAVGRVEAAQGNERTVLVTPVGDEAQTAVPHDA